jgi:selenocysteine lyase/cysteine desulfurase
MIQNQRYLFDIPNEIAYFNSAAIAPQLKESKARIISGTDLKCQPWKRTAMSFFEDAETVRQLSAKAFGGDADGYAIIPSASYGFSTISRAIEPDLKKGDSILMIAEEFPSNVLPWKRAAKESGATIITVPTPENGDWTQAIIDNINMNVRVVSISSCHWTNGTKIDLVAIGKVCREFNCLYAIDVSQSLGAMPLSIDEVKPDFLVAAGCKWLLFPYGVSLLYVAEQWRDSRPLEETWLARENAEDLVGLVNCSEQYMAGSRRFDVGEKCASTILPGAIAALEQLNKWGVSEIAESLSVINNKIGLHIEQLGFQLFEESLRCPHMFGAKLPKQYKGNLVRELELKKIYISQRGNSLRFSPHLYIDENDVNRLLSSISELLLN